jgi:hypothetical protein
MPSGGLGRRPSHQSRADADTKGTVPPMEKLLALMIPILGITTFGLWVTGIGGAIARRIGGDPARHSVAHDERLERLEQELTAMRQQLGETQERVDFAERMLTQVREAQRLPPPR